MCGENLKSCKVPFVVHGSPPRVRGKLQFLSECHVLLRITPACAGKTPARSDSCSPESDHPRVCGENLSLYEISRSIHGSPPRVRGKPITWIVLAVMARITPACAGKTTLRLLCRSSTADHPRVCGENSCLCSHSACSSGSPPRVRGKPVVVPDLYDAERITPACAGKTLSHSHRNRRKSDHPRVCGENAGKKSEIS